MLADPRQIEHERLLEGEPDLLGDLLEYRVLGDELGAAGQAVVPVGAPRDLHRLAGDQRPGPGDRGVVARRRGDQVVVVVGPRLVVVLNRRHLGVGEQRQQPLEPSAAAQRQPPSPVEPPPAAPGVLVFVGAGIALAGAGLDVVEPHVFDTGPVGPGLFAGDRAGVATDALVQVHHHRQLRHDAHQYSTSWLRRRITVISSRWLPVGPR